MHVHVLRFRWTIDGGYFSCDCGATYDTIRALDGAEGGA